MLAAGIPELLNLRGPRAILLIFCLLFFLNPPPIAKSGLLFNTLSATVGPLYCCCCGGGTWLKYPMFEEGPCGGGGGGAGVEYAS